MSRSYTAVLSVIAILFVIGAALPVHAQFTGTDPLTLDIHPQYPTPYSFVTVTPQSTQFDLAASTVTVLVDGGTVWQGSGSQGVNVQVGGPGSHTSVVVKVVNGGQTYTQQAVLRPASVALVEEPTSTTHPFYQGGSLVAPEGRVRLVALADMRTANGARIDPATLVYTWKFGDQILESQSGIGHSVLSATAPVRYRDAPVTVTVTDINNTVSAQAGTVVSPVDPVIHLYRNDPLLGPLFGIALSDTYTMTGQEDTFRAVPYYFSSTPSLAWTVNGNGQGSEKDITVRSSGNGTGTASLSVTATPPSGFQTASAMLSVVFGSKTSLGIFGI